MGGRNSTASATLAADYNHLRLDDRSYPFEECTTLLNMQNTYLQMNAVNSPVAEGTISDTYEKYKAVS